MITTTRDFLVTLSQFETARHEMCSSDHIRLYCVRFADIGSVTTAFPSESGAATPRTSYAAAAPPQRPARWFVVTGDEARKLVVAVQNGHSYELVCILKRQP
jgi:hypothetical protein